MNITYPIPENESDRLDALASYNLMDTAPEVDFEELTILASEICQTPIALISLIDDKRQWFKSKVGLDANETERELAFCAHTIINANDVMVVNDARKDARFANNPLVTGDPSVIFYAGVPLTNPEGFPLGSLCVIDHEPKNLTADQLKSLRILAKQVLTQMELRRKVAELQKAKSDLLETNSFVQKFATTAAHDIKNPLSSIQLSLQALQLRLTTAKDVKSLKLVELSMDASKRLLRFVDQMLDYSTSPSKLITNQSSVYLNALLKNVMDMVEVPVGIRVNLPRVDYQITCSHVALEQIFLNLVSNAIRYNDKEQGIIEITFAEDAGFYTFAVADNGMGIAEKNREKIFNKDVTLNMIDRFDKKGTGIGLYTVKALVEKLGGAIAVTGSVGAGSTFTFTIKKTMANLAAAEVNAVLDQQ